MTTNKEEWRINYSICNFEDDDTARSFCDEWKSKSRSIIDKLCRGWRLYEYYANNNLKLIYIDYNKKK